MAIGSTNSASRRNKRVTCRVDCIFLAGRQCPLTNAAATVHEGACPSPELRLPEEMERWGGEEPYTAKGEPRCSPLAGRRTRHLSYLVTEGAGLSARKGRSEGRASRRAGAAGVCVPPSFHSSIYFLESRVSHPVPQGVLPPTLSLWGTGPVRSEARDCRSAGRGLTPGASGTLGPGTSAELQRGALAREGKAVRWRARREAHVWGRREFRSQHQAANAVLHLTLGSPC